MVLGLILTISKLVRPKNAENNQLFSKNAGMRHLSYGLALQRNPLSDVAILRSECAFTDISPWTPQDGERSRRLTTRFSNSSVNRESFFLFDQLCQKPIEVFPYISGAGFGSLFEELVLAFAKRARQDPQITPNTSANDKISPKSVA
jgi:hypothetical protein